LKNGTLNLARCVLRRFSLLESYGSISNAALRAPRCAIRCVSGRVMNNQLLRQDSNKARWMRPNADR
ncbi:MAG TPA: hypothetical protein DD655_05455, partial [Halieaceae bacterium]|nr:hypothetical protein [Halieaceae bacterium]